MNNIKVDLTVDANGLSCPMPIVRLKKGIAQLEAGQVVLLQATDKGSLADIKAWADSTGNQYLGSLEKEGVYKHYLRKASSDEVIERKHPLIATNEELMKKLADKEDIQILDVREEAEYAFSHIPGAISLPLGELDDTLTSLSLGKLVDTLTSLSQDKDVYVICRTGHRSDLACQKLSAKGFKKVINVTPGMNNWTGELDGIK